MALTMSNCINGDLLKLLKDCLKSCGKTGSDAKVRELW